MSYRRQPTELIAREGYSDYIATGDSVLESFGSGIKSVVTGGLNILTGAARAEGQASAYQQMQGQGSSWVLPVVAIGGLGIVAVLLLRRRKR